MSAMNGIVEHLGRETIKSYENFDEWLKDHDKQIRADAINDCIEEVYRIAKSTTDVNKHLIYENVARKLEMLKEQKNDNNGTD